MASSQRLEWDASGVQSELEIQKHDVLCLGQRQESVLRCLTLAAKLVQAKPGWFNQPLALYQNSGLGVLPYFCFFTEGCK